MERTAAQRPRTAITAAVAIVIAIACFRVVIGGRTFGDERYLFEEAPALSNIGDRVATGELPEWWDRVGLGVPFAGNVDHPALYPPAWVTAVAPARLAIADLLVVAHLLAMAIGVGFLARRAGASDAAAIVAGAAAGVGGPAFVSIGAGAIFALAWCPWIWLTAHALAHADGRLQRIRWSIALAMLTAAQLVAGAIVLVPATLVVAAAIAVSQGRAIHAAYVVLAAAMAGLLGAVLLVPAAHIVLAPGEPAPGWSALAALVWPSSTAGYVGAPVLILAVTGTRGRAPLALASAGLVLLLAGALLEADLLAPAGLVACVLAGRGLTSIIDGQRWLVLVAAGLAASVALAIGLAAADRPTGVALGLFAVVLIAVARWPARAASASSACLGAIAVGHLIAWSWRAVPQVDRAPFDRAPLLLAELEPAPGSAPPPRIVRPRIQAPGVARSRRSQVVDSRSTVAAGQDDALAQAHRTAEPNSATRFGVAYARGRDRALSSALEQTWRAAAMASERFLDLYGIAAIAAPSSLRIASGMPVLGEDLVAGVVLLANESRRPRAFVAPRWRWFAADEDALAEIFPVALGGDRARTRGLGHATVRLSGVGTDSEVVPGPTPLRPCEVTSYRAERVVLSCPAETDGYAVLLDAPDAGWTSTVDGVARPIERADLLARAVRKHPGESRVVMSYCAPGLRAGSIVSALAWLNALVALALARRRRAT